MGLFLRLQLLRPQYSEGLVDKRTFLTWLVQQLSSCHLAQAGFITRLADEYLDDIVHSRALSRSFVEAALSKLHEVGTPVSLHRCPNVKQAFRFAQHTHRIY